MAGQFAQLLFFKRFLANARNDVFYAIIYFNYAQRVKFRWSLNQFNLFSVIFSSTGYFCFVEQKPNVELIQSNLSDILEKRFISE